MTLTRKFAEKHSPDRWGGVKKTISVNDDQGSKRRLKGKKRKKIQPWGKEHLESHPWWLA